MPDRLDVSAELVGFLEDLELPTTEAELLEDLALVAQALDEVKAMQTALYARRLALYQAGQAREPAVTQKALAGAAGVTDISVGVALSKARGKTDAGT